MAATTQHAVFRGLLSDVQSGLSLDTDYVYLTHAPVFAPRDDREVQIIPGSPQVVDPKSGNGLVVEEFRVVGWRRLYLDQGGRSTERIADATDGLLKLMSDVRQVLIQSNANGTATYPVVFIQGSPIVESDEHPGWGFAEDTYRIGYEITWSTA